MMRKSVNAIIKDDSPGFDDICDYNDLGELGDFIRVKQDASWYFKPQKPWVIRNSDVPLVSPPGLSGYFFSRDIELECFQYNREWAHGRHEHPKFLFAYLNLSTGCTLRCDGCFQGLDKYRRKVVHWQSSWLADRLEEILDYLVSRGGKSVAYAGVGELFTDPGAFELIERVRARGLGFVVFTNGQSLTNRQLVEYLDDLGVTLILSFRDIDEVEHDQRTHRCSSFRRTVTALSHCLQGRFRNEQRLAVEMPVTQKNRDRAADLLVVCRALNVTPLIETYVVLGRSDEEIKEALTFAETDIFFEDLSALDRTLGYDTQTEWGQRIVARPPCRRPQFTFTVSEDQKIMGCPANPRILGSLENNSVEMAVETSAAKRHTLYSELCPCSTFVGLNSEKPPQWLPDELRKLIKI